MRCVFCTPSPPRRSPPPINRGRAPSGLYSYLSTFLKKGERRKEKVAGAMCPAWFSPFSFFISYFKTIRS